MKNIIIAGIALNLLIGCAVTAVREPAVGAGQGYMAYLATPQMGQSMRAASSDPDWRDGNADSRPIMPGETLVLGELEGPGIIEHIWTTMTANEYGYSRLLVLRMYWDDTPHPSVEVPLGDFFGVGHGMDRSFSSFPISVSSEGRARNCYWPMPFRSSARITITNEGRNPVMAFFWYINWRKLPSLSPDTLYFHAKYRQEHPTTMGQNYLIADIEGGGHFVGTLLNVRQRQSGWWGEGDDFFFIDGEEEPRLRGTGTEDYFCDAWGFRKFHYPFYGVSMYDGGYDALTRTTVYRWHIPDPVLFSKSLRVEIEHKGTVYDDDGTVLTQFGEREDDFSSVAFWYQTNPHEPFPPLPEPYERVYHDPADLVEFEDLLDEVTVTGGDATIQYGPWSGNAQLIWTPNDPHHRLTAPIEIKQSGNYLLRLVVTESFDYGVFSIFLNDTLLTSSTDLFAAEFRSTERDYGPVELEEGKHDLVFLNLGRNESSQGYFLGIDCLLLQRQ